MREMRMRRENVKSEGGWLLEPKEGGQKGGKGFGACGLRLRTVFVKLLVRENS